MLRGARVPPWEQEHSRARPYRGLVSRPALGADAVRALRPGAFAERVLTQPACAGGGRALRARGVVVAPAVPGGAGAGGPRVAVRAPIVVASAGTLHTPALLLRSGLDGGGRVGANLRLHPATVGIAFFPKVPGPPPCVLPRGSCRRQRRAPARPPAAMHGTRRQPALRR